MLSFFCWLLVFQLVMAGLLGVNGPLLQFEQKTAQMERYEEFISIQLFIMVGFALYLSYIKCASYQAIGVVCVLNLIIMQGGMVLEGIAQLAQLSIKGKALTIVASYCSIAMMITYGIIFGRVHLGQLGWIVCIGMLGYTSNNFLNQLNWFDMSDSLCGYTGLSVTVYLFGAMYGVGVSACLCLRKQTEDGMKISKSITTTYASLIIGVIGMLFMWVLLPSVNSAYPLLFQYHREEIQNIQGISIMNTIIGLSSGAVGSLAISLLMRDREKVQVEDMMGGSLMGGIMIGSASFMEDNIGISMLMSFLTALLGQFLYIKIKTQKAENADFCCRWRDTFGFLTIFALPALLGSFMASIQMIIQSHQKYHSCGQNIATSLIDIGITCAFAVILGCLAGFLVTCSCCPTIEKEDDYYDDQMFFDVPYESDLLRENQQ